MLATVPKPSFLVIKVSLVLLSLHELADRIRDVSCNPA